MLDLYVTIIIILLMFILKLNKFTVTTIFILLLKITTR